MNPPQVYLCSPSWTLFPPPSPNPPSGSSQCTSPKHPVSCIEPGLATRFIHDIIHVSMPFSQISPPSSSPTESIWLIYTSVSKQDFNVDETSCTGRKCQTKVTPSWRKSWCQSIKQQRICWLLFDGNASVDMKLKSLLDYYSENPEILKIIAKESLPVVWKIKSKTWLQNVIFQDWSLNYTIPETEKHYLEKGIPFCIILLLNSAPGHTPFMDNFIFILPSK